MPTLIPGSVPANPVPVLAGLAYVQCSPVFFADFVANAAKYGGDAGAGGEYEDIAKTHARLRALITQRSDMITKCLADEKSRVGFVANPCDSAARGLISGIEVNIATLSGVLAARLPRIESMTGMSGLSQAMKLDAIPDPIAGSRVKTLEEWTRES